MQQSQAVYNQQAAGMPTNIIRKRPQDQESLNQAKRRRPTDRNLPARIESYVPESKVYGEMLNLERKLDATIMRKRLEIQDAVGRPSKVKRTLRIFLSNLSSDQMQNDIDDENIDLAGDIAPSWTLKIEGRLLEPMASTTKKQQPPSRKFTSFFRNIVVELERDPNLYPDGNVIEWIKTPGAPDYDGLEIKRKGDANVKARIFMQLDQEPAKFNLSPMLKSLLDISTETKPAIMVAMWQYIKHNKLQDTEDRRVIHCNAAMTQMFGVPKLTFSQIGELIGQHLSPPDPIVLEYVIRTDKDFHQSRHAYDIEVDIDDGLRAKMIAAVSSTQTQKDIMALDDKIVQGIQAINNAKIKRDFLLQFARSPVDFSNKWIASQARDLEVILGESRVNAEDMRKAGFYKQDWVKEAVFHYLTAKTQQRMQELLNQKGQ